MERTEIVFLKMCPHTSCGTAVKPGIYGLALTMGKWFLTDNPATVGQILMISSADPHEILILIKR